MCIRDSGREKTSRLFNSAPEVVIPLSWISSIGKIEKHRDRIQIREESDGEVIWKDKEIYKSIEQVVNAGIKNISVIELMVFLHIHHPDSYFEFEEVREWIFSSRAKFLKLVRNGGNPILKINPSAFRRVIKHTLEEEE